MLTIATLVLALVPAVGGEKVVAPALEARIAAASPAELVPCYAVLSARPDYAKLGAELGGIPRGARGRELAARLRVHDAAHRNVILQKLAAFEKAGSAARVLDLYIGNAVAFAASPAAIREISQLPGILYLQYDAPAPAGSTSDELAPAEPAPAAAPSMAMITASHLTQIKATDVWAKGFTGQNVTVALIDLGTAYTHPNLQNHIWTNPGEIPGNGIDDDGNGFIDDIRGWNFDINNSNVFNTGHGTNTAGLIVGDGTLVDGFGNQYKTGVAPDSKLMLCVNGNAQTSFWGCQQYAVANGADLVSSSQSYKWFIGFFPDYHMFRSMSDAELAAGIIHINSSGNQGLDTANFPFPFNIATPANCPSPWAHPSQVQHGLSSVIAVTSVNASDVLVSSSSQGPSGWDNILQYNATYPWVQQSAYWDYPYFGGQPGLLKPDVCAPTGVTTTDGVSGYNLSFTGTSASAPIVAGVVALMLSANPELEPRHIAHLLQATAVDVGAVGKDTRLGAGRVNAYEAWRRGLVSIRTQPAISVQLDNYIAFLNHTIPGDAGYLILSLNNSPTVVPGIATIDVADPLGFLLEGFVSATPDYTPFGFTIPYDPVLVGIRFYLQLGVDDTAGATGTWIISAIDSFVIKP